MTRPLPGREEAASPPAPRVLFLIRSLEVGGAQRQLVELVKGLADTGWEVWVFEMYGGGELGRDLDGVAGIHRMDLRKSGRWDLFGFTWRLLRAARAARPDVVHGYLPVANELALLAGWWSGARVVWGIRMAGWWTGPRLTFSALERVEEARPGPLFRLGAFLSRFADAIVSNSQAGRDFVVARGYDPRRMQVIANGIDSVRFAPDHDAGRVVRSRWGVPPGTRLVGVVARLDPLKGHATFLEAARLLSEVPDLSFACVGDGVPGSLDALRDEVVRLGLRDRVKVVGAEQDMPAVYNALDLLVSSSSAEGFSNSIGEAMSTGVPCVVTDTGDSALIVGETGRVVPVGDAGRMAAATGEMLASLSPALKAAARARIVELFSTERLVRQTVDLLATLRPRSTAHG